MNEKNTRIYWIILCVVLITLTVGSWSYRVMILDKSQDKKMNKLFHNNNLYLLTTLTIIIVISAVLRLVVYKKLPLVRDVIRIIALIAFIAAILLIAFKSLN